MPYILLLTSVRHRADPSLVWWASVDLTAQVRAIVMEQVSLQTLGMLLLWISKLPINISSCFNPLPKLYSVESLCFEFSWFTLFLSVPVSIYLTKRSLSEDMHLLKHLRFNIASFILIHKRPGIYPPTHLYSSTSSTTLSPLLSLYLHSIKHTFTLRLTSPPPPPPQPSFPKQAPTSADYDKTSRNYHLSLPSPCNANGTSLSFPVRYLRRWVCGLLRSRGCPYQSRHVSDNGRFLRLQKGR